MSCIIENRIEVTLKLSHEQAYFLRCLFQNAMNEESDTDKEIREALFALLEDVPEFY